VTFVPRTFEVILSDMAAHMRANTTLTDFSVGSVIRTLLEACALEDDEQYHQMVQLLDDFSYNTATGADLDRRAADFNLSRLPSFASSGTVRFTNEALTKSYLQFDIDVSVLATSSFLDDSSDFPISGYPYTIRIGEGTSSVEDVTVSMNDVTTNTLTTSACLYDHSAGDLVSFVSGSTQYAGVGTLVQVPAQGDNSPIVFQTKEIATQSSGNYYSNAVAIVASQDGSDGNVGSGRITEFSSSAPFPGASVVNVSDTNGGRDQETDREFRDRIRSKIAELAKGIISAIEGAVKGTYDSLTGKTITTARLVESFIDREHKVYVDDGTGFSPSRVVMGRSSLKGSITGPTVVVVVDDASSFPASGYVLISPEDTTQVEVIHYSSKDTAASTLTLDTPTTRNHDDDDEIMLVDFLGTSELGQKHFQLSQYPIQENTIELYDDSLGTGNYTLRAFDTDYWMNRTNGQVEYVDPGLPSSVNVYAHYTYYTGIFAIAQKIVTGDPSNFVAYPGTAAAGVPIYVDTPDIVPIHATISISSAAGYDEDTVREQARVAIENYIDGLSIGENVILSRMVERAFTVDGVTNAIVKSPSSDIVILEYELPKSYDNAGNRLVTVF
jgi:uncharacterized phage protein gp47/JayE